MEQLRLAAIERNVVRDNSRADVRDQPQIGVGRFAETFQNVSDAVRAERLVVDWVMSFADDREVIRARREKTLPFVRQQKKMFFADLVHLAPDVIFARR